MVIFMFLPNSAWQVRGQYTDVRGQLEIVRGRHCAYPPILICFYLKDPGYCVTGSGSNSAWLDP